MITAQATKWAAEIAVNDCKKFGKICFCNVHAYKATGTLVSDETLFSLPWKPNVNANNAFISAVGRNRSNGTTGAITIRIDPEYNTVITTENYSNYNEVRCYIVYLAE